MASSILNYVALLGWSPRGELAEREVFTLPELAEAFDSGYVPAKGLVEQVVLGGGGEVLAAPYHVGDAHEVVVGTRAVWWRGRWT